MSSQGRVSKQQYFQQALAAQQQQAAAAAAAFNQQQAAAAAHRKSTAAAFTPASGPIQQAADRDGYSSAGAMSLREMATVRYIRYREWMELVVGTGKETTSYVKPVILPLPTAAEADEKTTDVSVDGCVLSDRAAFYKHASETLRSETLATSSSTASTDDDNAKPHASETELSTRFGARIVPQQKVTRVQVDLGESRTTPSSSKDVTEDQLERYRQAIGAAAATVGAVGEAEQGDTEMGEGQAQQQQQYQQQLQPQQ